MKAYIPKGVVSAVFCALMMVSCLDGGSSGTMTAGGGIGGTGVVSQGSITAFGSIVVNGTEFDTRSAVIIVDGEEIGVGDDAVLSNLDIGRVVMVEGTGSEDDSSSTADRVTYNKNVEGPVEHIRDIDTNTREILVLGQTVMVNTVTAFKKTSFGTIAEDDMVEVSGFADDTGAIWATFLEKTGAFTSGVIVEVTGSVANLDDVLETFEINGLTVDYSSADTSGLSEAVPFEGLLVEVSGTLDETGAEMFATEVEPGDALDVDDADGIEVTGFVTDVASASEFVVGNQPVQTDDDTDFIDGNPEDVQPGAKLEAEGSLVDGILFAAEIEFWAPDQIEVEGDVTDVASDTEFTIDGQVVQTGEDTEYEDGTPEDIDIGVRVEIKGRLNDGILIADKVSFEKE
jgi:Domain of unknown function (DUF5666)